jgi:hypothetical protein
VWVQGSWREKRMAEEVDSIEEIYQCQDLDRRQCQED